MNMGALDNVLPRHALPNGVDVRSRDAVALRKDLVRLVALADGSDIVLGQLARVFPVGLGGPSAG